MKIAILGILGKPVKKDALGGTELFTCDLANELVKRGHDVTLFSTKDSITKAKLYSFLSSDFFKVQDKFTQRRAGVMHSSLFSDFIHINKEFDLVHVSTVEWYYFLPYLSLLKIPHVITVHSKILSDNDLNFLKEKYPEANYVFVSSNFAKEFPGFKNKFVVYNGINLNGFSEQSQDYIFWVGRFIDYKGSKEAIQIAKKVKKQILVGGYGIETEYFQKEIKPLISTSDKIKFLGELNFERKNKYFKNAKLFLNPIKWEEPFGLVMIESMACGTPVIAFDRGSVPEVVKDGETGFICSQDDIEAMVNAIKKIYDMPEKEYITMRQNCRKHVEENFTIEKMVDGYEKIYGKVIKDWKKKNGR